MGYTHYWTLDSNHQLEWAEALANVVRPIIDASPVKLEVEFADDGIYLNGRQCARSKRFNKAYCSCPTCERNQHETFVLPTIIANLPRPAYHDHIGPHERWAFCKTARKPYDVVVVAILSALEHEAPEAIRVRSDGSLYSGKEGWNDHIEDGVELARRALGDPAIQAPRSLREKAEDAA